jgi:hypothetical protein
MRGIAYRRHAEARAKARARRKLRARWNWTPRDGIPLEKDPGRVGCLATTPAPCSCFACGNPRRHFGELLMSERRVRDQMEHQLEELHAAG